MSPRGKRRLAADVADLTEAEAAKPTPEPEPTTALAARGNADGSAVVNYQELDEKLCGGMTRMSMDMLTWVNYAAQAQAAKIWERYGYEKSEDYWERRVRIGYRTLRRWLSIHEALQALPEGKTRAQISDAMAEMGSEKASILAPVFHDSGQDVTAWVEAAGKLSREALQEAVSDALGAARARPTKGSKEPGDRFFSMLLNAMPPEEQDAVRAVFEAGAYLMGGTRNMVAVMVTMTQEVASDWFQAVEVKKSRQGSAPGQDGPQAAPGAPVEEAATA